MTRNQAVDWDQLLFNNPTRAVERIKAEAIADARQIVHQDYLRATNRERWEKLFYGTYPALAAHREVVEMKMVEVAQEMPNENLDLANSIIAERTEAHVKHRQRYARQDQERAMWSGGPGFDGPPPPTPMTQGTTLGDTISSRRERRREAHAGRAMFGSK